jgi:hypothetical protein
MSQPGIAPVHETRHAKSMVYPLLPYIIHNGFYSLDTLTILLSIQHPAYQPILYVDAPRIGPEDRQGAYRKVMAFEM